uniref:Uncharacterized protein n=1 Tax=Marseillevirus LCMAC202 TaxID=2506606 RepID=A0A481YX98_9VIRU|nr:MAG: hypothetical protein LCMAC202_01240 [Marseillevirus LCMAC202]
MFVQILSFIGSGIYQTTKLAILAIGTTAIVAGITKPDKSSFDLYFQNYYKTTISTTTPTTTLAYLQAIPKNSNNFMNVLCNKVAPYIVSKQIDDYVVCKIAIVNIPDNLKPLYFIGIFGNWYSFKR